MFFLGFFWGLVCLTWVFLGLSSFLKMNRFFTSCFFKVLVLRTSGVF